MLKMIYAIPLIGWMLRDAAEGGDEAKLWFLANLAMIWGLAVAFFGYPALIVPLLVVVPTIFVLLVALSWSR